MSTRALLDTHAFIWFISGSDRLSGRARELIADRQNALLISSVSLWEIAIKYGLGKLTLQRPFEQLIPDQLRQHEIKILDIEPQHLAALLRLPSHHRDPFDRLIIAQAVTESLPIISVDPLFDSYGVQRLR